ncbi:hypothetical protein R3P38DRAFT_3337144 [Favolaschia claudopus]|uniref:Uncharacterized protein n=1 Tax=Favolaschia claudopus TaxID=2862362 RepID=A0AAV9Z2K7_9AGAR
MRELIGQRPNLIPTGLGHSGSAVDDGVLIPDVHGDEVDEFDDNASASSVPLDGWDATPGHTPEPELKRGSRKRRASEVDATGSGDDYEPSSDVESESAPPNVDKDDVGDADDDGEREEKPKPRRKNPPKPATSTPAVSAPSDAPKPTKKTKLAEFAEIAKEDERTRQKELELAALRTRQEMKSTEVKGRCFELREKRKREEKRAKQKAKQEKDMAKLRIKELRLIHAHEQRMLLAGGGGQPSTSTSHAGPFSSAASYSSSSSRYAASHASSTSSHYAASEASEYDGYNDFSNFSGNADAGPSNSQSQNFSELDSFNFSSLPSNPSYID